MRVTLFDYGAGNLHSLAKALAIGGDSIRVEADARRAIETDLLVLPGVGAFASAAERIAPARDRLRAAIADGLPCLGICLGMQLLFESSDEGPGAGLGVIPGRVTRLASRRVPHMGWNVVEPARAPKPGNGSRSDRPPGSLSSERYYYAHSFACRPADPESVVSWSAHEGDRFPAMVQRGSAAGVQFHPEKSSRAGVEFLTSYLDTLVLQPGAPPCS